MSRRGKGSITKTKNGSFLIQATVPCEGKQKRISRRITGTAREAEKVLKDLLKQADDMEASLVCPSLHEFFYSTFLPRCENKGLQKTSITSYESVFRNHIKSLENKKVCDVSSKDISELLNSLSHGSAVHVKACLSAIFSLAEELELVEISIMRRKYTLPAKENRKRKHDKTILSWDEMVAIAEEIQGESFEPAFLFMAFGGMRREEACAIQAYDVEEVTRDGKTFALVSIYKKVQNIKGEIVVTEKTKTKDSERTAVIVPPFSKRVLDLKHQLIKNGQVWFLEEDGRLLNPDTVSKRFDRWFLDKSHKRIPLSNLRHSFTTAMISKGIDSAMVSKMTGHSTLNVTYKNYLRPKTDDFINLL